MIAGPVRYRAQRIPFACSAEDFSLVISSMAGPGVTGTLMVGLDLGSIGPAIGKLGVTCLAVSGVVILVVACLGIALIRTIFAALTRMGRSARACPRR